MDAKTMDTGDCSEEDRCDLSEQQLVHANINPKTLLATDYLNHFNEVIMLIDMLDMMPECTDDVLQWRPKTYRQHFADSRFAERDLAIKAYEQAPRPVRDAFDTNVAAIDRVIFRTQSMLRDHGATTPCDANAISNILNDELRPLMDRASSIVNGTYMKESVLPSQHAQDAVDALFS